MDLCEIFVWKVMIGLISIAKSIEKTITYFLHKKMELSVRLDILFCPISSDEFSVYPIYFVVWYFDKQTGRDNYLHHTLLTQDEC